MKKYGYEPNKNRMQVRMIRVREQKVVPVQYSNPYKAFRSFLKNMVQYV
jgi:hypothetical protein